VKRLGTLRDSILKETPDANVIATVDYQQYLGDMESIALTQKKWVKSTGVQVHKNSLELFQEF
jgi:hypothetical protein